MPLKRRLTVLLPLFLAAYGLCRAQVDFRQPDGTGGSIEERNLVVTTAQIEDPAERVTVLDEFAGNTPKAPIVPLRSTTF